MWLLQFSCHHFRFRSSGHRSAPGQLLHNKPCPFLTVDHLFNHRRIYINCQPVAALLSQTSFALEEKDCWLEIAVHSHDLSVFPLQRFDLQVSALASSGKSATAAWWLSKRGCL